MHTVTINFGKDEANRLVGWLTEYLSIANSSIFKGIKGNEVLTSRIDLTIKYIQREIDKV
jgi:hypothetical protein